jgi:hypothetical protein
MTQQDKFLLGFDETEGLKIFGTFFCDKNSECVGRFIKMME